MKSFESLTYLKSFPQKVTPSYRVRGRWVNYIPMQSKNSDSCIPYMHIKCFHKISTLSHWPLTLFQFDCEEKHAIGKNTCERSHLRAESQRDIFLFWVGCFIRSAGDPKLFIFISKVVRDQKRWELINVHYEKFDNCLITAWK